MNIRNAIQSIEVLQKANPSTMASLVSSAALTKKKKGEFLFWDRDQVETIYFLAKGKLSLHKTGINGDKKIIFLMDSGSVINEEILSSSTCSANCEILENSYLISFQTDRFISIMSSDFELMKAITDSLSMKVRKLYRQLKNTPGTIRGDKKIAAKLWRMSLEQDNSARQDGSAPYAAVIPLTITCLAEMVGSKRETVSRQIKAMSQMGVLHHKNGKFYIPDRDVLRNYFNEA